jgi:DNA-binding response OmpR family regulator
MKEDEELARLPVIIVSARDAKRDAKRGRFVIGKDRFIEKPFEVRDLIDAVNQALEKQPVSL